jgi:hypothetical protein
LAAEIEMHYPVGNKDFSYGGCVPPHSPEADDSLRDLREQLRQGSRDSFQLLENIWDNPICSIRHDEESRCIFIAWRQYATQTQFRYIHEKLLRVICEHQVLKILGDDTALPAIPSEDRFWIIDDWFPRAVQCGLRYAASKVPEAYFGKLAVNHIQSSAPADLTIRSFEKIEEARAWLNNVAAS